MVMRGRDDAQRSKSFRSGIGNCKANNRGNVAHQRFSTDHRRATCTQKRSLVPCLHLGLITLHVLNSKLYIEGIHTLLVLSIPRTNIRIWLYNQIDFYNFRAAIAGGH
jgi:hypothetical protein